MYNEACYISVAVELQAMQMWSNAAACENPELQYQLEDEQLKVVAQEKVLEVIICLRSEVWPVQDDRYIESKVNKTNNALGIIQRSFTDIHADTLIHLHYHDYYTKHWFTPALSTVMQLHSQSMLHRCSFWMVSKSRPTKLVPEAWTGEQGVMFCSGI